jgi:hypothetical protein
LEFGKPFGRGSLQKSSLKTSLIIGCKNSV